jgi:hypothetical protein
VSLAIIRHCCTTTNLFFFFSAGFQPANLSSPHSYIIYPTIRRNMSLSGVYEVGHTLVKRRQLLPLLAAGGVMPGYKKRSSQTRGTANEVHAMILIQGPDRLKFPIADLVGLFFRLA